MLVLSRTAGFRAQEQLETKAWACKSQASLVRYWMKRGVTFRSLLVLKVLLGSKYVDKLWELVPTQHENLCCVTGAKPMAAIQWLVLPPAASSHFMAVSSTLCQNSKGAHGPKKGGESLCCCSAQSVYMPWDFHCLLNSCLFLRLLLVCVTCLLFLHRHSELPSNACRSFRWTTNNSRGASGPQKRTRCSHSWCKKCGWGTTSHTGKVSPPPHLKKFYLVPLQLPPSFLSTSQSPCLYL